MFYTNTRSPVKSPGSRGRTPRELAGARKLQIGDHAEVVAGPDAVHRLVEDALAAGDLQRRPAVLAAADEHVVEAPERPVPVPDQRVGRRERLPPLVAVRALPGIPVADARPVERLPAG